MENSFVDLVAEYIVEQKVPFEQIELILPNERAKKYLQKALFKQVKKPFLSPKFYTIDQWILQFNSKTIVDKTNLLITLYQIHLEKNKNLEDTSFDEFLHWGSMLLNDIDEIEKYLVESSLLFRNLKDIREIEQWSFNTTEKLTEQQEKFLLFWENLGLYYQTLIERLANDKQTLRGSIYRNLANNLHAYVSTENSYFFIGLNALSAAELSIIKKMKTSYNTHVLVDVDNYYIKNSQHEAGYFHRKLMQELGIKAFEFQQDYYAKSQAKITLLPCPQFSSQVLVAQDFLNQVPENEFADTLILLADENLLTPLLHHLPKRINKANITIGLPLKNTTINSWLGLLFSIQENIQKQGKSSIYFKELIKFFRHPFVHHFLSAENKIKINELINNIIKKNRIYINVAKIEVDQELADFMHLVFTPWKENWIIALQKIREMNAVLLKKFTPNEGLHFEVQLIKTLDSTLIEFQNTVAQASFPEMKIRTFKNLFNQQWSKAALSYFGNPIDGVQVMGILETRMLDFKNIVILGLNEGSFPPLNPIKSLIPMDLRNYVGLPTMRDKQALFAHHFYRLLHRAENVLITYHEGADTFALKDKSRYILQIELELVNQFPNITLESNSVKTACSPALSNAKIEKTPALLQRMDEVFAQSTSPSTLNKIYTCRLDFYYTKLLKFGEVEEVEEELESNTMGSIVHKVLEEAYLPYQESKRIIGPLDIEAMKKRCPDLIHKAFLEVFDDSEEAFMKGKNYLNYAVVKEMVFSFFNFESKQLNKFKQELLIKDLEKPLTHSLKIELNGEDKTFTINGNADRIDVFGKKVRIIDYKSGKVQKTDLPSASDLEKVSTTDDIQSLAKKKHFIQLYTYWYLYYQNYGQFADEVAIISLVNMSQNPFIFEIPKEKQTLFLEAYPSFIEFLVKDLYDPKTNFEHNPKARYCAYCD